MTPKKVERAGQWDHRSLSVSCIHVCACGEQSRKLLGIRIWWGSNPEVMMIAPHERIRLRLEHILHGYCRMIFGIWNSSSVSKRTGPLASGQDEVLLGNAMDVKRLLRLLGENRKDDQALIQMTIFRLTWLLFHTTTCLINVVRENYGSRPPPVTCPVL